MSHAADAPARARWHEGRWVLPSLLAVQSMVVAVLLTWPTALHPARRVLGGEHADTLKHLWTLWWFETHASREGLGLHTALLNQPRGLDLWPVEPLNGLAALALGWLPVVAIANLLALANLTATGIAGGLLGAALSRGRTGALIGGLLLQTCSWSLFAIHVGVGELQHLWLLPLGLWLLLRLVETRAKRWILALAAVLGLGTVACFYYGFFLALALLVLGAWAVLVGPRRLDLALRLAGAAGIAILVVWPFVSLFSSSYGDDFDVGRPFLDYVFREGLGQVVVDPVSARLRWQDLLEGRAALWGRGLADLEAYGAGRLLGVPLLALALVGVLRRPRAGLPLLVVAALGVVLALGSYLSDGTSDLVFRGARLRMPGLFLNRALTFVAEPINFPVRFLALTSVALAGLGCCALAGLGRLPRGLLVGLALLNVADVQVRGLLPWPLPAFELRDLSALAAMADVGSLAGGRGAVLDLGAAIRDDPESRHVCITAQLAHGQPIQAVPIDRLEFHAREGRLFAAGLALVEDLSAAYRGMPGVVPPRDYRGDFHLLRKAGFDRVLVVSMGGRNPLPPQLLAAVDAAFGARVLSTPVAVAYRVPEVSASAQERAAWELEHARRAASVRAQLGPPGPMQPFGAGHPPPGPGPASR